MKTATRVAMNQRLAPNSLYSRPRVRLRFDMRELQSLVVVIGDLRAGNDTL
jgi:hypothetical protein